MNASPGSKGLLVLFLFSAAAAADPVDPPDISSQTLQEYSALCDIPAEVHIRRSMYLDSLEAELERLYIEVDTLLSGAPEIRSEFRNAHLQFMSYAETWAAFLENAQWYDPETGEPAWGSVYGYTLIQVKAAMYWERILLYRLFSGGGLTGGLEEITVPSDRIGGR